MLREKIARAYGDDAVSILHEDCYYRRRDDLDLDQRTRINYDHPDAMEHDLLCDHLKQLKNQISIEIPRYDYGQHNRTSESTNLKPAQLIILEGILVLHAAEIRELLNLKIFVDAAMEVCLERRIHRDTNERDRTRDSVLKQFESTVRPMFHQFIEPTKAHADLIVPFAGENGKAVEVLFDHLSQLWNSIG